MLTIYVLKLQNNKFYVGKTSNLTYRLDNHFSEGGSLWTKKYKPISILELRPNRPNTDEQIVTQEYMQKYGIDNVRGGPWCNISLTKQEIEMINKIIKGNLDLCYNCDSSNHFASQCTKKKISQPKSCDRCGRKNHITQNCYATTDINNYEIEDEDIWECKHCGKEFETKKGCTFHENVHCKSKYKSNSKLHNETNCCLRCGRDNHYATSCYASTDVQGYNL